MAFGRKTMSLRPLDDTGNLYHSYYALPSFGYTVEIRKAINIQRFHQNVSAFDRGAEYDQRRCAFKLLLDTNPFAADGNMFGIPFAIEALSVNNPSNRVRMRLPNNSGFYPAGPDRGDSGDFIFSLTENPKYTSMRTTPFAMGEVEIKALFHETPYRAVTPAPKDFGGKFTLGAVTGIREPSISPKQEQGVSRVISLGGENYQQGAYTGEYLTDLTITTTTGKMAEIANFIQNERGEGFKISGSENFYAWGSHFTTGSDNLKPCDVKLLSANFIFTHAAPNLWSVPVQLWREAERYVFHGDGLPEIAKGGGGD